MCKSGDRSWCGGWSEICRRERSEGAQKRGEYGPDLRGAGLRASASDPARAPAWLIAVRRCWCRQRRGGPKRALGAALASGLDGAGELATRVDGFPLGVALVKSPRLALERLQCTNSATLFARRAGGKSGRLEVWRAPGEKGAAARRSHWWGWWSRCLILSPASLRADTRRRFVSRPSTRPLVWDK